MVASKGLLIGQLTDKTRFGVRNSVKNKNHLLRVITTEVLLKAFGPVQGPTYTKERQKKNQCKKDPKIDLMKRDERVGFCHKTENDIDITKVT